MTKIKRIWDRTRQDFETLEYFCKDNPKAQNQINFVNTDLDQLYTATLPKKKKKVDSNAHLIKIFHVYEKIMKLEKKHKKLIPISILQKNLAKDKVLVINKKQFDSVLNKLVACAALFIPKKGFVQRI